MIERIHWLGNASFRINGFPHDGPVVYIDPVQLPLDSPPADLILISHEYADHCSPVDIERICKPTTTILSNQRVADSLPVEVKVLRPWQGAYQVGDVAVTAVPAYTVNNAYNSPKFEGLGFIISIMRYDIYYAGVTDLIPEMEKIGCDIALLPLGGKYSMTLDEAVEAVNRIRPGYAVPIVQSIGNLESKLIGRRFCEMVDSTFNTYELRPESSRIA